MDNVNSKNLEKKIEFLPEANKYEFFNQIKVSKYKNTYYRFIFGVQGVEFNELGQVEDKIVFTTSFILPENTVKAMILGISEVENIYKDNKLK